MVHREAGRDEPTRVGGGGRCLAEAANHAGDHAQECVALQNMGTSLCVGRVCLCVCACCVLLFARARARVCALSRVCSHFSRSSLCYAVRAVPPVRCVRACVRVLLLSVRGEYAGACVCVCVGSVAAAVKIGISLKISGPPALGPLAL